MWYHSGRFFSVSDFHVVLFSEWPPQNRILQSRYKENLCRFRFLSTSCSLEHSDCSIIVTRYKQGIVEVKVCLSQFQFSSVQSLSRVRLFATPWTAARQASLSITTSWSLPKLMSIESVMPSNHLILFCPLLLLLSIFPSIRVFSNELALRIRWPKYWSFSFSISPFNEHPGLISFRLDWLDPPCSPRDPQESSPTPQLKSINSSAFSFLYKSV